MARPTDYTPELLKKTKEYLENWEEIDAIPSVAGLSHYLKIARSTIYDWASQDDKKEFSDILAEILSDQERTLLNKGLLGAFNSNITKLALGKHGYSDKQELTGKDGLAIPLQLVNYGDNKSTIQTEEVPTSSPEGV